jgi:hypothetical protein
MTLEEMTALGGLFQRLAASNGALFAETTSTCRVDQIPGITVGDLNRISQLATLLSQANLGNLTVFGEISGGVELGAEDIPSIEGELASVRLMKHAEPNTAYFVTRAGFETALGNTQFMLSARKIWIAEDFLPFATGSCVYLPWGSAVEQQGLEDSFDSPCRLVRDQSHHLAPTDIRPWYLIVPGDETSDVFSAWKEHAVRNLIFCLPTEIRASDASSQVVLKGARSAFADVDLSQPQSQLFNVVTEAVRWIYDQRRDTETKFHLLNNHLALYWPENAKWPLGLGKVLDHALASAREAFAFHLQDDSKEAIKSLGDLRKALQDEVARSQTATRDLLSALWRDVAIAGAAFALRSATTNSPAVNLVSLGAAALLLVSLLTTVVSNWRFDVLAKQVRAQWKKRLYAFMSDKQWAELVTQPISRARWVYRISIGPVSAVYFVLIGALLWVAYPAEVLAIAEHLLKLPALTWQLISDLSDRFTSHAVVLPSPASAPATR